MSKENYIPNKTQDKITGELHRMMRRLISVEGFSIADVLAVIHAESITQIATVFGGKVAADCAERSAGHVALFPACPVSLSPDLGVMQ